MDVLLRIEFMPLEDVSTIRDTVNAIYKPRLQKCPTSKWVLMPSTLNCNLSYLMRFDNGTIENLKKELKSKLITKFKQVVGNPTTTAVIQCVDRVGDTNAHYTKLLDESPHEQIVELSAANPPPVRTQPVAALATTSIQNVQVSAVPKYAIPRPPPSVSSGAGPQEPLAGTCAAQSVADAGGDASKNSQGRNSEAAQASVFHFTRPGNTSHSKAFLNSRIFFVLQLNSADHGLESKIADFKANLIHDIQAKSYEAFIDADLTAERLHIRIACSWKTPCHAITIKRIIDNAIRNRWSLEEKIRIFNLNTDPASLSNRNPPSGSRWLQHSQAKGAAYRMPMESFVLELGKEVRAHESHLLKCVTLAEVFAHAKANQVLLSNVHDVLRWKFPHQPPVLGSDPARFQQHKPKNASQNSGRADILDSESSVEAPPLNSSQIISAGESEILPVSLAGGPILTPVSSNSTASPAPCRARSLQFGSGAVAQTPSEGAPPACGPAGVYHNCFALVTLCGAVSV